MRCPGVRSGSVADALRGGESAGVRAHQYRRRPAARRTSRPSRRPGSGRCRPPDSAVPGGGWGPRPDRRQVLVVEGVPEHGGAPDQPPHPDLLPVGGRQELPVLAEGGVLLAVSARSGSRPPTGRPRPARRRRTPRRAPVPRRRAPAAGALAADVAPRSQRPGTVRPSVRSRTCGEPPRGADGDQPAVRARPGRPACPPPRTAASRPRPNAPAARSSSDRSRRRASREVHDGRRRQRSPVQRRGRVPQPYPVAGRPLDRQQPPVRARPDHARRPPAGDRRRSGGAVPRPRSARRGPSTLRSVRPKSAR